MDPDVLANIQVKSKEEIIAQFSEIVHRHRRKFLRKNLRPCPNNCAHADVSRRGVQGCGKCDSWNPEQCRQESLFMPVNTKEELADQFRADLRDPHVLRHLYPDVAVFLWITNQLDGGTLKDRVISTVEKRLPVKEERK